MPTPIPVPVREQMVRLHQLGWTSAWIAQHLRCSPRTVQRILEQATTSDSLAPRYSPQTRRQRCLPDEAQRLVRDLTQQHPTWGAEYLRLRLLELKLPYSWPPARTLQRWMAEVRPEAERRQRRADQRPRANGVHDVWQMDAVEQLPLADGTKVSWLRLTDECSGAFLHTRVFFPRLLYPSSRATGADRDREVF